jgi:arginyl-tRNA--protein-N-Asp/Glu arginylyltransferase
MIMKDPMLYSKSVHVSVVDEATLDLLLEKGWYRAGSRFFTSAFLLYQGNLYNTIWLRIRLKDFAWSAKMNELFHRNRRFNTVFEKCIIDEELNNLFSSYRKHAHFIQANSLAEYVHGSSYEISDKHLHCVKLYDGKKLIGCGIYEAGQISFEGLVSFYDGNYKKYSPGRYLMMCKINRALELGKEYFYTGYYVPDQAKFDYKLLISPRYLEYYDPTYNLWHKYKGYNDYTDELGIIRKATYDIEKHLSENGVSSKTKIYPFFEYNIHTYFGYAIPLTIPFMVIIDPDENYNKDSFNVVVFDTRKNVYRLLNVEFYGTFYSPPYRDMKDYYTDALLVVNTEIACGDYRSIIDGISQFSDQETN